MPGAKYRVTRTVIVFTCIAPLVTQNGATHVGTIRDMTSTCKSSAGRGCGQSSIYLEEMPEFKERGLRYTGRGAPSTAGNLARDYFHFKRTQAFILIAQKMIESDDGSVWNQLQSQDPELLNPSNWAYEELQSKNTS